jgi:hypothetical protein
MYSGTVYLAGFMPLMLAHFSSNCVTPVWVKLSSHQSFTSFLAPLDKFPIFLTCHEWSDTVGGKMRLTKARQMQTTQLNS